MYAIHFIAKDYRGGEETVNSGVLDGKGFLSKALALAYLKSHIVPEDKEMLISCYGTDKGAPIIVEDYFDDSCSLEVYDRKTRELLNEEDYEIVEISSVS